MWGSGLIKSWKNRTPSHAVMNAPMFKGLVKQYDYRGLDRKEIRSGFRALVREFGSQFDLDRDLPIIVSFCNEIEQIDKDVRALGFRGVFDTLLAPIQAVANFNVAIDLPVLLESYLKLESQDQFPRLLLNSRREGGASPINEIIRGQPEFSIVRDLPYLVDIAITTSKFGRSHFLSFQLPEAIEILRPSFKINQDLPWLAKLAKYHEHRNLINGLSLVVKALGENFDTKKDLPLIITFCDHINAKKASTEKWLFLGDFLTGLSEALKAIGGKREVSLTEDLPLLIYFNDSINELLKTSVYDRRYESYFHDLAVVINAMEGNFDQIKDIPVIMYPSSQQHVF